jgi:hypothetical protein
MKRNLVVLSTLLGTLAVLMVFGLTAVLATNITPSVEITGSAGAVNLCNGGYFEIPVIRKINGVGSSNAQSYVENAGGYVASAKEGDYTGVVVNAAGTYSISLPMGLGLTSDQNIIFEVYSFDGVWGQGNWTYFTRVSFNCATGAVQYIQNEGMVDEPATIDLGDVVVDGRPDLQVNPNLRIRVTPVAGPALELPGDIRTAPQITVRGS